MYTEDLHIEGTYTTVETYAHRGDIDTEEIYIQRGHTHRWDIHARSRRIPATNGGSFNAGQPSVPSLSALPNSKSNDLPGAGMQALRLAGVGCYWGSGATGLAPAGKGLAAATGMAPQARICVPGPGPGTACQPCASSAEAYSCSQHPQKAPV